MKKYLALLLAVLTLVTVFCACGDKADGKDKPGSDVGADDFDPNARWEHEVYHEYYPVLKSMADAYFNRKSYIQYDQLNMNRIGLTSMRTERVTAETATANKIVHMDCGVFIRNVMEQAFGYVIPNASTILAADYSNESGERVFHFMGELGQPIEKELAAKEELLSVIQPGDVLYYNYVDNNHLWLYLGEGNMYHCTGNDYGYNTFKDDVEEDGSIRKTTIDEAIASRDLFDEKNKVAVLRVFNTGAKPTEQGQIRADKLHNIIINKTHTAPEGISVMPGDEVKITINIRNGRYQEDVTLNVTDVVPKGMEYVSGADKNDNGKLSWTVTIPGRKSATIEYTLRVKKDESLIGRLINIKETKIEGLVLNDTPVYVGVTLSQDKQDAITAIKTSDLTSTTEEALIKEVYQKIGMSVTSQSSEKYLKDLFRDYPSNATKATTRPIWKKDSITGLTFVPNLYGGKACADMTGGVGIRIRGVYEQTVIPGDIIVSTRMLSEGSSVLYVYMGDGRVVTIKDGHPAEESAAIVLDGLFGQSAFCVLRPSLAYPLDESKVGEMKAPVIKTQPKDMEVSYGDFVGPVVAATTESGIACTYQWYKNATNSNQGGTAIEGATEAQLTFTTDMFNPGESTYLYCVVTATRVFDGKTMSTASNTASLKMGEKKMNILLIGSGALKRDGKFDVGEYLAGLLKTEGQAIGVDYVTKGNDYNLFESGLVGSGKANVVEKLEQKLYSAVIIQIGRDHAVSTASTRSEEVSAYRDIAKRVKEYSPDCKILYVMGPWRQDTEGVASNWYARYQERGANIKTQEDHKREIRAFYDKDIKSAVAGAMHIDIITGFEKALAAGINPFGTANADMDYSSQNGAYLTACIAYTYITGKTPVGNTGVANAGTLTSAQMTTLQQIAADIALAQ